MVGNLVSGKRIAQASGRDLGQTDDNDQVRPTAERDLSDSVYITDRFSVQDSA